jgi:hypothetical protein
MNLVMVYDFLDVQDIKREIYTKIYYFSMQE